MLSFALWSGDSLFVPHSTGFIRRARWLGVMVAVLTLTVGGITAEQTAGEFEKAIQLAPFVVKGSPYSISIHARTKADRRYAENFAEEVVGTAYETLDGFKGKGLVIIGAKDEPHPVSIMRQFLAMAKAGELDPGIANSVVELEGFLKKWQSEMRMDEKSNAAMQLDFEIILKALPLPLEGVASRLYQLAWAEGFDEARVGQKLRSLTRADFAGNELTRFDWVFYLPPNEASNAALKELVNKGMAKDKMGPFKRAAIRSALVIFRPVVKKAIEAMRKGMLFMTVLRAESPYNEGDIKALTGVYIQAMMPDLKPGSGDEHRRVITAIEKQKLANAEYAKDPFVKPARLAAYDPAAYALGEGEYTLEPPKATHWFKREGDYFQWKYKDQSPRTFYPAGDGLLVNENGSMTIRFLVDATGAVTGIEERWVRRRQTIPRKS